MICENVSQRGPDDAQNSVNYPATVADYSTGGAGSTGDNTVKNIACDSSVYVGAVVRMDVGTVINALADIEINSNAIGICTAKQSSTVCNVQFTGYTDEIFTGLVTNTNYFLSEVTPGALTTTPPTGSGNVVLKIGSPLTGTRLIVNIGTQLVRA